MGDKDIDLSVWVIEISLLWYLLMFFLLEVDVLFKIKKSIN